MKTEELNIFIEGIKTFFSMNLGDDIEVGAAIEVNPPETPAYDLTGVIGISGVKKGCVYFTAQKEVIKNILINIGEKEINNELLSDMTGEIANTIAGNASAAFGPDYQMSVPIVVAGRPESINLPKHLVASVIPVIWRDFTSNLVICFE